MRYEIRLLRLHSIAHYGMNGYDLETKLAYDSKQCQHILPHAIYQLSFSCQRFSHIFSELFL
jgi:hypothetical protein